MLLLNYDRCLAALLPKNDMLNVLVLESHCMLFTSLNQAFSWLDLFQMFSVVYMRVIYFSSWKIHFILWYTLICNFLFSCMLMVFKDFELFTAVDVYSRGGRITFLHTQLDLVRAPYWLWYVFELMDRYGLLQAHNYLHYVRCFKQYWLKTPLSGTAGNKDKTLEQSRLPLASEAKVYLWRTKNCIRVRGMT